MRSVAAALLAVALLAPASAPAQSPGCPAGTEAVAGRCLPPELARIVRDAPTVDDRPVRRETGRLCCKRCSKGIPCGDSCISATKTCRKPPGCAC